MEDLGSQLRDFLGEHGLIKAKLRLDLKYIYIDNELTGVEIFIKGPCKNE